MVVFAFLCHDRHGHLLAAPRGEEPQARERGLFVANEPWCPWWVKCTFKTTLPSLAFLGKKWGGGEGGIKLHV